MGHDKRAVHRAKWVMSDAGTIIENGFVDIEAGIIKVIGRGLPVNTGAVIDHGPGVLMPALANVHTHLELSAFKNKLDFGGGFGNWVRQLISRRDAATEDDLLSGVHQGIREMLMSGTALVGEISTTGLTRDLVLQSELAGIWFREKLGSREDEPAEITLERDQGAGPQKCSLAGHAPHTTSPEMLIHLKNATRLKRLPFSIHVAESGDEIEFLGTGRGAWAKFLMERGIDFSSWGLPVASPVQYLDRLGLLGPDTIAVHLIRTDHRDIQILRESGTKVCLCLRSNRNLHDCLPDLKAIMQSGIEPCLGTDSLASTDSLNMFDEMAFVSSRFPSLAPERILSMATISGAAALGLDSAFGSLAPGKIGPLFYVPVNAPTAAKLIEKLVNADFSGTGFRI